MLCLQDATNAASTISRVMSIPELFTEIIHMALDSSPPGIHSYHNKGTSVASFRNIINYELTFRFHAEYYEKLGSAVVASHVCTAWRRICLDTPTLWARQVGQLPAATAIILSRAREANLDLTWTSRSDLPDDWKTMERSRIRGIDFTMSVKARLRQRRAGVSWLETFLEGPSPSLVRLKLGGRFQVGKDVRTYSLDAPALEFIDLYDSAFPGSFTSFSAPSLRALQLTGSYCCLEDIITVLHSAPQLASVNITHCRLTWSGAALSTNRALGPFALKCIAFNHNNDNGGKRLIAFFSQCTAITKRVVILRDTALPKPLLSRCLEMVLVPGTCICVLTVDETLELYRSARYDHASSGSLLQFEELSARFQTVHCSTLLHTSIQRLAGLSHITTLVLHTANAHTTPPTETDIRSLMCALPCVETYWVIDSGFKAPHYSVDLAYDLFVNALGPGTLKSGRANRSHTPFPRLCVLGVGVNVDDHTSLLNLIYHILRKRASDDMLTQGVLSLPLVPREAGTIGTRLLNLVHEVLWADDQV